jgi:hypothetical protein
VTPVGTTDLAIGKLTMSGRVSIVIGTPGGGDHFGFVAQSIGSLKVDTSILTLHLGRSNNEVLLSLLGDIRLIEI